MALYEFSTALVFFTLGLICHGIDYVLLAAVQDILAGTDLPTSIFLVVMTFPSSVMFLIGPYFVTNISYGYRICMVTVCMVITYPLIIFAEGTTWKLFGVTLEAFCYALGEVTFLGLTSLFSTERVLFAYSVGCGCGLLGSALYYIGM